MYCSILLVATAFIYVKHYHNEYSVVEFFSGEIEVYFSEIDQSFKLNKMQESWSGANPILHIEDISTSSISAENIRIEVDTLKSLINFSIIIKDVSIDKLEISPPKITNSTNTNLAIEIPFSGESPLRIKEIIYHGKMKKLPINDFLGNIKITNNSVLVTAELPSGFISLESEPRLEKINLNSSIDLYQVFEFIKANLQIDMGMLELKGKGFAKIKYDLRKKEIIDYGVVELKNASFEIKNANLMIDNISGNLNFSDNYNLIGDISYEILGGKSSGKIEFLDLFKTIKLKGSGEIDGGRIKTIKGAEMVDFISGVTPYEVDFLLTPKKIEIKTKSSGDNLNINLPMPYQPNKGDILGDINIFPHNKNISLSFDYDETNIKINTESGLLKNIDIANIGTPISDLDGDINISGNWDSVDVEGWINKFSKGDHGGKSPTIQFEAFADTLILDGIKLTNFIGSGIISDNRKLINFNSSEVKGVLDESTETNIEINQLDIIRIYEHLTKVRHPSKDLKTINVDIKNMNVDNIFGKGKITITKNNNVADIYISETSIGHLSLSGHIRKDGNNINVGSNDDLFEIQGEDISARDNFPVNIGRFKLGTYLSWTGLGSEMKKSTLNGKAYLRGTDLSVIGLKNEKLIKIINAIDINKIVAKSSSENEGIKFNKFKINTEFENGTLKPLDKILKIEGNDLNVEIKGSYSFPEDKIDAELKAYTGISSKALSLGLLSGVAPQLVGGIYVLDMVTGEHIGKVFAKNIKIKGSLSSPEID